MGPGGSDDRSMNHMDIFKEEKKVSADELAMKCKRTKSVKVYHKFFSLRNGKHKIAITWRGAEGLRLEEQVQKDANNILALSLILSPPKSCPLLFWLTNHLIDL